ncbi:MAG: DUF1566 domain-containing protein [Deltaproteobacteria bacterium]|nr:DUF1566 domain-containing protein [Deltaproteobacteria bacterium]
MNNSMKNTLASVFGLIILMVTTVVWAAPVPDTGQTKCYNDTVEIPCPSPGQPFYGQDANYTINPMSYTKLDGGGNALPDSATSWVTVKDNVTGLIWETETNNLQYSNKVYTWYDSNPATNGGYAGTPGGGTDTEDLIKALNDAHYGGFSDWRLPTIKELDSIVYLDAYVDYIKMTSMFINTSYFPDTRGLSLGIPIIQGVYWSSNTDANNSQSALCMDFGWYGQPVTCSKDPQTNSGGLLLYTYARAVRGGLSKSAYVNNGNGTVTDTSTGLMWQQNTPESSMTWEQALSNCESLALGGYTDWRLPNQKELRSLVDYSTSNPAINITYFPNTVSSYYWSSTPSSSGVSSVQSDEYLYDFSYVVDFQHVSSNYVQNKNNKYYVRAVRGGLSPTPDIKANGIGGEITVTSDTPVSVTISLISGNKNGIPADWWFAINSPWGWYFLTTSGLTQIPIPLYQSTPLYDFSDQKMMEGQLPVGEYEFFFGVYVTPNDSTESPLYLDSVKVHVN